MTKFGTQAEEQTQGCGAVNQNADADTRLVQGWFVLNVTYAVTGEGGRQK